MLRVAVFFIIVVKTFALPVNQDYTNNDDSSTKPLWVFYGDWMEQIINSDLLAGNYFTIVYNGSRLPGRETRYGHRAWYIKAKYKLNNNNHVHSEELEGPDENNIMTKDIFLPYGTYRISLWFKHWGYPGLRNGYYATGVTYDSNYEQNYNADVLPPEHTIVFEKSQAENVYGELKRGENFVIMYSPERIAGDYPVTAQIRYSDESTIHDYLLQPSNNGYLTATPRIPGGADKIIIWFYKKISENEKAYDSDYGKNYKFQVSGENVAVAMAK